MKGRKFEPKTKGVFGIDPATLNKLKTKSVGTIRSLERCTKRADYRLRGLVLPENFAGFMNCWKAHLHWIRLHLAYFKPLRSFLKGSKGLLQITLNELIEMAKEMISAQGLLLPSDTKLRRVMRLYSWSSRRFREGHYTVHYVLEPGSANSPVALR